MSQVEVIGKFSLPFHIAGSDPKANPIMLLAHQDVVPLATGTETRMDLPAVFRASKRWLLHGGRGVWDTGNHVSTRSGEANLIAGF